MMIKIWNRSAPQAALALSLGLLLSGCGGIATNRTVYSVHEPVVEKVNYTLDVTTGAGGLAYAEQRRVAGWFESLDLRYGDRISIDDPLDSGATRDAVAAIAGRYGLILSDQAPVTAGPLGAGSARIVISRSKARVPNCPNWSAKTDFNPNNATSPNYGCAINGNLAAMVANPEHLLKGAQGGSETVIMSSTKAIEKYREAAPTGAGGTAVKAQASDGK